MFNKKKSPTQKLFKAILLLILVFALVFLGYSIGKPVLEFFDNLGTNSTPETPDEPEIPDLEPIEDETPKAPDETADDKLDDFTEPEPEAVKSGILYVTFNDEETPVLTLTNAIEQAISLDCKGVCLDLVSEGGQINYLSQNNLANSSEAIRADALDPKECVAMIEDNGLVPYAHLSALSDHLASWYDRSICYQFEDGSSKWLDNSLSAGGKPWISPFSDNAKAYISDLVNEISAAGFNGLIASEFEFPPFRTKDLTYVGKIVQSETRYIALCDFSDAISDAADFDEFYAIEVDALDILTGSCEILTDPALINADYVYVRYSSDEIGTRIDKSDGSVISFEGLDEQYKLAQVYRLVATALEGADLEIVPVVDSTLEYASVLDVLKTIGFDVTMASVAY